MPDCPEQAFLDQIFPPQRADAFFDALYGGAEEGAYDIRLVCQGVAENKAAMLFELKQRPGKCLKCSLTYGLPNVFRRHPILNLAGAAQAIAERLGWGKNFTWTVGETMELDMETHAIPFIVSMRD